MTGHAEAVRDTGSVHAVLARIAETVAAELGRAFAIHAPNVDRSPHKIAGYGVIHVAFKLAITAGGRAHHGALLAPLPDVITLGSLAQGLPDDSILARRDASELDRATKDSIVTIGGWIGAATDAALRAMFEGRVTARLEGCQGVRAGMAPAFERTPGVDLLVARAPARLAKFPSFELPVMLPAIAPPQV
jgi:hypothetical protein